MADLETRKQQLITTCENWADAAEEYWFDVDDEMGCFGPGYIHWGVQSNFNYVGLMATLATTEGTRNQERNLQRAAAALRFNMASHLTGYRTGLNGKKWGCTWITQLGLERGFHGISRLIPHLSDADQDALKTMLITEADWLLNSAHRGSMKGVFGGEWAHEGANAPESNVWWATLLWRIAQLYPDEPNAALWEDRAHDYFINGVSRRQDEEVDTPAGGKTVRERYKGPNFFPNFALDHHGYLNVGYMFICTSNVAMLHFDLKKAEQKRPDTLDHNQKEFWDTIKNFIFADGRLARIGGDGRIRYAYCQEYLLPSLLYAADQLGDGAALALAENQLDLIFKEATDADGFFYGRRMAYFRAGNPHYYTRLESDRACVCSQFLNYAPLVDWGRKTEPDYSKTWQWEEPEHGAVAVRTPKRMASFSWRAESQTQAMCQPLEDGDLAEWYLNLTPDIRFIGDYETGRRAHRKLLAEHSELIQDGFVTCGSVMEGVNVIVPEGGNITDQAVTHIAYAALPDKQTCVGLQYTAASADKSTFTRSVKSLHLNIPNDIYNDYTRTVYTDDKEIILQSPAAADEVIDTCSLHLNIDGKLGVVGIYGSTSLKIDRSTAPRGGNFENIRVEEICLELENEVKRRGFNEIIVDSAFAVLASVNAEQTAAFTGKQLTFEHEAVRGVSVTGLDGKAYALIANFGEAEVTVAVMGKKVSLPSGRAQIVF